MTVYFVSNKKDFEKSLLANHATNPPVFYSFMKNGRTSLIGIYQFHTKYYVIDFREELESIDQATSIFSSEIQATTHFIHHGDLPDS